MSQPDRGLIDTSVYIAKESGRQLDLAALPDEWFASVVTLAELTSGVLAAKDLFTRSRRIGTLNLMADAELLPVDEDVAAQWARLRAQVSAAGRRVNVNDLWIAATAAAHRLPIVTQDADFDVLVEVGGLEIIRV